MCPPPVEVPPTPPAGAAPIVPPPLPIPSADPLKERPVEDLELAPKPPPLNNSLQF
jgi:hypothetical protein